MKKILLSLFVFIFSFNSFSHSYAEDFLSLDGESAILIDANTLETLYEKNSHSQLYPASTTKIMTAILAIELGNLDDVITIDQEVVNLTDGSHIALEPGEKLTLEQLLNALLIASANDSALAIAKHISGDINSFIQLMNNKAKELGALNTNFVNPNGLHDDLHVSSTYDLALIAKYAMDNDIFKNIVANYNYTIPITNKKTEPRNLYSKNKLLHGNQKIKIAEESVPIKYPGANGIKTGYTSVSKNCLVSSVEKDGRNFISVVLKSNGLNIYSDTHKLFNYGFENFDTVQFGFPNKFIDNFKIKNGIVSFVSGITLDESSFIINKNNISNVTEKIIPLENLKAPIKKGDILGNLEYRLDDKIIGKTDIVSTMDVDIDPMSSLPRKLLSKWYLFIFLFIILVRIYSINQKKKIRKKRRIKKNKI